MLLIITISFSKRLFGILLFDYPWIQEQSNRDEPKNQNRKKLRMSKQKKKKKK